MPRYNKTILNYYNDNSHIGSYDQNDKNVGTGLVGSPSCGDVMKLQIKIERDKKSNLDKIVDAKILVFGCGSAKASSSYIAKQIVGKTINEALKIKNSDIAEYLGLPKIKLHCSVLAESAIKQAIEDYKSKNICSKTKKATQNKKVEKKMNKKFDIIISNEALDFVKKQLEKKIKNSAGIRLALEEGHCGLAYKVSYVKSNEDISDYICKTKNGLNIFVKKNEATILNGTKIEYKEEGLKRGLIFKNPKETGRCNCGLNFFTKDKKQNKESCK